MIYKILFILSLTFLFINTSNGENTIEIIVKSNSKHKIRGVVWFDNTNIRGKELSKEVEKTTKLVVPSTEDFFILRIMYSNLYYYEYLINSRGNYYLTQNEDKIILNSNVPCAKYDLSVDSLLLTNFYHKQDPIKLYLHAEEIVDWGKPTAAKQIGKIKESAYHQTLIYIPKAISMIDSLRNLGYFSEKIAAYYRNKLKFQQLNLSLAEDKLSADSIKAIFQLYPPKIEQYPYRYLFKFGELVATKLYVETAKKMNFNDGLNRDVTEIYDHIAQSDILPEVLKSQLKVYYLKGIVNTSPKEIGIKYYKQFINSNVDTNLIAEAKTENYNKLFVKDFKTIIQAYDSSQVTFKELASPKAYTYIDFWASWCGPCLAEMPQSKQLRDTYGEDINFVYISLDTNEDKWKRAVSRLELNQADNFWIPSAFESGVAKLYKMSSIPRYMIMDKNGKIINENAPRPSDSKIRDILDVLAKR